MFLKRHFTPRKILLLIVFLVSIGFFWFFAFVSSEDTAFDDGNNYHRHEIDIQIKDIKLETQIADSKPEQSTGLSDHENLNHNEAMLFIFDTVGKYGFHMPDMNFPIDIFWLDEQKKVVFIKEDADPQDFPEVYTPSESALYVVETVAGFAETYSINIGDTFIWQD